MRGEGTMKGQNRACTLPAEVEEGGTEYAETEEETCDGDGRKCIVLQYWTVDDAIESIGERMASNPDDYGELLDDLGLKGMATRMAGSKNGALDELVSECTEAIAADRDAILRALGTSEGEARWIRLVEPPSPNLYWRYWMEFDPWYEGAPP